MPISNLRLHSNALVTNCNNFGKNLLQGELFEIMIESKITEKVPLYTNIDETKVCLQGSEKISIKTL